MSAHLGGLEIVDAVGLAGANTLASGSSLDTTSVDSLKVAGIIVPVTKIVTFNILVTALSQAIFIATEALQVVAVREVHGVASVSGTLNVEKLTSTTAPESGTAILTGTINLAATANTVNTGALSGTVATLQLAAGNRLGIVLAGTLTSLVGCMVQVEFKRV